MSELSIGRPPRFAGDVLFVCFFGAFSGLLFILTMDSKTMEVTQHPNHQPVPKMVDLDGFCGIFVVFV